MKVIRVCKRINSPITEVFYSGPISKAALVTVVAHEAKLSRLDAEITVETIIDSIISALRKGEKVEIRGFGSFRTRERAPRRAHNPMTGESVNVPAKRVVYFKPGKELREFLIGRPWSKMEVPEWKTDRPREATPHEEAAAESMAGSTSGSTED
jgi:integration host factor subunit beta